MHGGKNMRNEVVEEHYLVNAIDTKDESIPMNRVKQAFRSQLLLEYERIRGQVSDERKILEATKKEREGVGVELYGLQKQLSHVQKKIETRGDEHQKLEAIRKNDEVLLSELKTKYSSVTEKYDEVKKHLVVKQADYENIKRSSSKALQFNEHTKNDIAYSKRLAEKSKELLKEIQQEKEEQDIYLSGLSNEIDVYETHIQLGKEQLRLQKIQTEEVEQSIEYICSDRGALAAEMKQLLKQWNLSLVALKQRDLAVDTAGTALKRSQNALKDSVVNLNGLQKDIRSMLLEVDTLTWTRDMLYEQISFIENEIQNILSAKESNHDVFENVTKSIKDLRVQLEDDNRRFKKEDLNIGKVQQQIDLMMKNRRIVDDKIHGRRLAHGLASRENSDFIKNEKRVANDLIEKEYEYTSLRNDIASIDVDILKTEENFCNLSIDKESLLTINRDLEAKIAKLESEIRSSHMAVLSKMNKLDRLNRKYEKMIEQMGEEEEPLGPFEGTIKKLESNILELEELANRLAMNDSDNQSVLMKIIIEVESTQKMNKEINSTLSVLNYQRLRLSQSIHKNQADLKIISSRVQAMHTDISRLNDLIGRQTTMHNELCTVIRTCKTQHLNEAEDLILHSKLLEEKNKVIKSETDVMVNELLAKELEILEYEKNIAIEKETYAVLHSSQNAEEIRGMEKEIHRMRHRLDIINRDEENIVRAIEVTILRRDNIALKHQNKSFPSITKKESSMNFADAKMRHVELSKLEIEQTQDESNVSYELYIYSKYTKRQH